MTLNGNVPARDEAIDAAKAQVIKDMQARTTLVVFLRPWNNGANQPGDVTRLYPDLATKLSAGAYPVVKEISESEAGQLAEGLDPVDAHMRRGASHAMAILPEGAQEVPPNSAPSMTTRPNDADLHASLAPVRAARESVEAQDRMGTISPRQALAGVAATDAAAAAARGASLATDRPIDHLLDQSAQHEPGATNPLADVAASAGIRLDGGHSIGTTAAPVDIGDMETDQPAQAGGDPVEMARKRRAARAAAAKQATDDSKPAT